MISSADGLAAAVYVTPVADTCKEIVDGTVRRTIPRDELVVASGPWVFSRAALSGALLRVRGHEGNMVNLLAFSKASDLRVRAVPRP